MYRAYNTRRNKFRQPKAFSTGKSDGSIYFKHREYITDIYPSSSVGSFNNNGYNINPGLITIFPWLCNIASSFQEYEFKRLKFIFKTMSGNALTSTNTSLGSVIMAIQYNVDQETFSSKAAMENAESSVSTVPSKSTALNVITRIRSTVLGNGLYVRNAATDPAKFDPRFYDLGIFQIATQGCQGNGVTNLGELWVEYTVCLRKPISLYSPTVSNQFSNVYNGSALLNFNLTGYNPSVGNVSLFENMTPIEGTPAFLSFADSSSAGSFNSSLNQYYPFKSIIKFPPTLSSGTFLMSVTNGINTSSAATNITVTAYTAVSQNDWIGQNQITAGIPMVFASNCTIIYTQNNIGFFSTATYISTLNSEFIVTVTGPNAFLDFAYNYLNDTGSNLWTAYNGLTTGIPADYVTKAASQGNAYPSTVCTLGPINVMVVPIPPNIVSSVTF